MIYAKASLTHEQIDVKLSIGCDGIEIQLLNELLGNRNEHDWLNADSVFNLNEFKDYPIAVIHAPLLKGHGDVLLERISDPADYKLLYEIFKIANYFGECQNKVVGVVMHSESYVEYLSDVGNSVDRIEKYLERILLDFPYTELYIENVSPLRGIGKGKALHLANNFMFDNVELVELLRKDLHTERIGTVLDTCHQMLTEKYIGALYDLVGDIPKPDLSISKYFEVNAPYMKLIHVCNMQGSGYGKGRHGVPFTKDTYNKLVTILQLHDKYVPSRPMTLEVEESDFLTSDGYRLTKSLIDKYYLYKGVTLK